MSPARAALVDEIEALAHVLANTGVWDENFEELRDAQAANLAALKETP